MVCTYFSSSVLNADQMAAVRHIVAERTGYTPPFVLYGPFGTGKTETIAQATMVLLKETRETRILICSQSNRSVSSVSFRVNFVLEYSYGKRSWLSQFVHLTSMLTVVSNTGKWHMPVVLSF